MFYGEKGNIENLPRDNVGDKVTSSVTLCSSESQVSFLFPLFHSRSVVVSVPGVFQFQIHSLILERYFYEFVEKINEIIKKYFFFPNIVCYLIWYGNSDMTLL
jgi:hypothetical protein